MFFPKKNVPFVLFLNLCRVRARQAKSVFLKKVEKRQAKSVFYLKI